MIGSTLLIAIVATAAAAGPSDPVTAAPSEAATAAQAPGEKIVCRRDAEIGSIRVIKTCKTRQQWLELSRQGEQDMKQFRKRQASTFNDNQ